MPFFVSSLVPSPSSDAETRTRHSSPVWTWTKFLKIAQWCPVLNTFLFMSNILLAYLGYAGQWFQRTASDEYKILLNYNWVFMDAALCMQDLGYIFLVTSFSVNSLTTFLPTEKVCQGFLAFWVDDLALGHLEEWNWLQACKFHSAAVQQYSSSAHW